MTLFKRHIFVCINQREDGHALGCCSSRGSIKMLEALKIEAKKQNLVVDIRFNKSGCLSQCALGPVIVIYPEATWYIKVQESDVPEIIAALKADTKVTRLLHPSPGQLPQ